MHMHREVAMHGLSQDGLLKSRFSLPREVFVSGLLSALLQEQAMAFTCSVNSLMSKKNFDSMLEWRDGWRMHVIHTEWRNSEQQHTETLVDFVALVL